MRFTVNELCEQLGGEVVGPDVEVDGAGIDSRRLVPGQLFVPLVAERNGHDFVPAALAAGAPAYLCNRAERARTGTWGGTAIVVSDTAHALTTLGEVARGRLPERVVGITGSVGKTTVKTLTAAGMGTTWPAVLASPGSFNNELGVPLTLLGATDDAGAAVIEMGARGVGHIRTLCAIARPTIGVVTAVGRAHLEQFGDLDGVARAKGELVEAVAPSGTVVLNGDDPRCVGMRDRATASVVTYGVVEPADVTASEIVLDEFQRPRFTVTSPWGGVTVELALSGSYQVGNALAAFAAAAAAGAAPEAIAAGLAQAEAPAGRMVLRTGRTGVVVIDDAYNANPTSMTAALQSLAAMGSGRRLAVLGQMAELGDTAADDHAEIMELAADLDIEVIAVDVADYGVRPVGIGEAVAAASALGPGDVVLVKGSRVAALERVVTGLVG